MATYSVPSMSCQHSVDAITAEVLKVEGVTDVDIDLDAKTVAVDGDGDIAAIDEAGFDVNS